MNLERTDDSTRIALGAISRHRVDLAQLGVECLHPLLLEAQFEGGARLWIRRSAGQVPSLEHRPQI